MQTSEIKRRNFLKIAGLGGATALIASGAVYQMTKVSSDAKAKVVVIGGGAAGISVASRLMRWLKTPDITIIDPSDRHYYQPGFTLIAGGVYSPDEVWLNQKDCIPSGAKWIKDSVVALDPEKKNITTAKSGNVQYDFLVLTPGLVLRWDLIEGIDESTLGNGNAHCIYTHDGAIKASKAMKEFAQKGGKGIFTDTYTKHKCGGAPKKVCLLTEHQSRKNNRRDALDINFYTASKQLYDESASLLYIYCAADLFSKEGKDLNLDIKRTMLLDVPALCDLFEQMKPEDDMAGFCKVLAQLYAVTLITSGNI